MADDSSDKTEQPTPRRLRKAAEQGDSAVSVELGQGIGLLVVLALLPVLLAATATTLAAALRSAIDTGQADLVSAAWLTLSLCAPLLGAAAAVAALVGFL